VSLGFLEWITLVVALALVMPFYRVMRGRTIYDRMIGVSVAGTNTVVLIILVGHLYRRLDMFVDIAIAYAMLNFASALVVAKYLERTEGEAE
jgi:multicomponent Na+:H+ antiporter subunit F